MRSSAVACLLCAGFLAQPASGTVYSQQYETPTASGSIASPLLAGDAFVAQTSVTALAPTISQVTNFTLGADVDGLAASLRWAVSDMVRFVGVSFDIVDSNGSLVASDTFQGLLGGFAASSIETGPLAAGDYSVQVSGAGVGISLANFGMTVLGGPDPVDVALGALPPPPADPNTFAPHTLVASQTLAGQLFAGDAALIEGLTPAGEPLSHTLVFTLGAGATDLNLGAAWVPASGPLTFVGVNIDLIDLATASVIASDTFQGLLPGSSAISSLAFSGLTPGASYAVSVTGNAVGVADYNLFLEVGGTRPPPAAIPLPATGCLLGSPLVLAAAFAAWRRRRCRGLPSRVGPRWDR
jgi:hypothetical protein